MKIQMNKNFIEKINNLKELIYLKKSKKHNENISEINKVKNDNNLECINDKENKTNIRKKEIEKNNLDVNSKINSKDNKKTYERAGANKSYFKYKFKSYFDNLFRNKQRIAKSYYVLLLFMVLLGVLSVYITARAYNSFSKENYTTVFSDNDGNNETNETVNKNNNNLDKVNIYNTNNEQVNADINKNKEAEQKAQNVGQVKNDQNFKKVEANNDSTNNNNTTTKKNMQIKIVPLSFSKPLDGKIIKPYSMDTVIYSKTLELWKTHDGIDISGDIGCDVKSVEKGTVKKVYDDSFYGKVIIIDHGQGYETLYGNLQEDVSVKEKQSVKKGQIIAKVGNTSIGEIKDEPHIHFQLFKDSKSIDPTDKIN